MGNAFYYKLAADCGGAPCVERGMLSLAICKPMIRARAEAGDLVFGFTADSLDRKNRLIYIAEVTNKCTDGTYYRDRKYARRGDCVYRLRQGRFAWKEGARHHGPQDVIHDLGVFPHYRRAAVLLSSDFRYFGKRGTDIYKDKFPRVKRAIENLGRGHRVHHSPILRDQLEQLKKWLWRKHPKRVLGPPTDAPSQKICHRGGGCGQTKRALSDC